MVPYDPLLPRVAGAIRATSVFKFKGMESHVVIVTDLDRLDTLRDRRKAYVGMSRARYKLYLIATNHALADLKRER
jgi:ATP-dependent exoDNAse (exonuclease V) alpha subunit